MTILALVGFAMVATFMTLIMTRRLSAIAALILVPTAFAIAAGFAADLGPMMLAGVRDLAPTGVMILFAILYFGTMIDVGLFEPLISRIVNIAHGDPVRITIGTVILALFVSLDGDGTTTYMITVAAMLPLYRHMRMDPRVMACLIILCSAVMNLLPWGGPTARVASALHLDAGTVFLGLLPAFVITAVWVVFVAWRLGLAERTRLRSLGSSDDDMAPGVIMPADDRASAAKPRLLLVNALLTAALMAALIADALPLPVLFMLGFAVALVINYPNVDEQRNRIAVHAANALAVVSLVFAAGIFTGILGGTKMIDAMASVVVNGLPSSMGPNLAPITALISIPATFLISNDAFYFGLVPVLAKTASQYGLSPLQIGLASLVGQQIHLLSPLVPSTYLLVGTSGIDFGAHQRFTLKWALGSCLVFFVAAVITGAFPLG